MATSGSTDFNQKLNEIIEDAYSHIGSFEEGSDLSPYQTLYGKRQLNKMVKAWAAKGNNLWVISRGDLPLVDGVNEYTVGPNGYLSIDRPLRITDAQWSTTSNDTPIHIISRKEYFDLPNKTSEGKPTQIYYDPKIPDGKIYVWPTPDNSTDSIKFSYHHFVDDFDSASNDTDFPQEWLEALSWNLAVRLCGSESIGIQERIAVKSIADEMLADALEFDIEFVELQFEPSLGVG